MLWNMNENHPIRQRQRIEIEISGMQAIRPAARHAESGHALAASVAYGRKRAGVAVGHQQSCPSLVAAGVLPSAAARSR